MSRLILAMAIGLTVGCSSPKPVAPAVAFPRIDAHAHLGPSDLPAAMEVYRRNGVVGVVNLSGGFGAMLDASLAAARPYQGRVVVLANLDPRGMLDAGWVERQVGALRRAREQGARGLKIHKSLGLGLMDPSGARVAVDDPRLDPVFEECGQLGFPVLIHTGDPQAFFRPPTPDNERYEELRLNPRWSFNGPRFPSWEQVFGEFERRVARHPGTTFVGVHFGNDPEEPARVAGLLRTHPNLLVDTAARLGEIGRMKPEALRAIFLEFKDRILFGTDFSYSGGEMVLGAPEETLPGSADADRFFAAHWRFFETNDRGIAHPTPIQGRWTVDAIGLPADVLHAVYHRNAERVFGMK